MPVSFLPLLTWLVIFGLLTASAFCGTKVLRNTSIGCGLFLLLVFSITYVPGALLERSAASGDPEAQYDYARWLENHGEGLNSVILWPSSPDIQGGYNWLRKSAEQEFPEAMFALGVRLKYGQHVPDGDGKFGGTGGNVFEYPDLGQQYIDRAHALGYKEPVTEQTFYWRHYRR